MKLETGTYQMPGGKIIVVTAILRREVTIEEDSADAALVYTALDDDNALIVFRDLEKHPVSSDLEYMTAKNFFKRVKKSGSFEQVPLFEKI